MKRLRRIVSIVVICMIFVINMSGCSTKNTLNTKKPVVTNKEQGEVLQTGSKEAEATNPNKNITICIDPGHQLKAITAKEAFAPGSNEKKPGVSSGTRGVFTKKPEYQLNLEVALKLRDLLQAKGYRVVMTRDKNDVTISNIERAEIANKAGADLFVRIHADGSESGEAMGFSILYPAEDSPYTKGIFNESKKAARFMETEIKRATRAKSRGIVQRDDMTGFNWSKVPVVLIEMGFMTNRDEDAILSTEDYQNKMAEGMLKGIETYIGNVHN